MIIIDIPIQHRKERQAHGNCWPTVILNCYILGLYYEFHPCSRDSSDSQVIFSLLICLLNDPVSRHFWVENVLVRPCVPCLVASSLEDIKSYSLWSSHYNTPASSQSFEALSFPPNSFHPLDYPPCLTPLLPIRHYHGCNPSWSLQGWRWLDCPACPELSLGRSSRCNHVIHQCAETQFKKLRVCSSLFPNTSFHLMFPTFPWLSSNLPCRLWTHASQSGILFFFTCSTTSAASGWERFHYLFSLAPVQFWKIRWKISSREQKEMGYFLILFKAKPITGTAIWDKEKGFWKTKHSTIPIATRESGFSTWLSRCL